MPKTVKTAPVKPTPATADAGRVTVGAGMMRFAATTKTVASTKDAGRVLVGAGMMRF